MYENLINQYKLLLEKEKNHEKIDDYIKGKEKLSDILDVWLIEGDPDVTYTGDGADIKIVGMITTDNKFELYFEFGLNDNERFSVENNTTNEVTYFRTYDGAIVYLKNIYKLYEEDYLKTKFIIECVEKIENGGIIQEYIGEDEFLNNYILSNNHVGVWLKKDRYLIIRESDDEKSYLCGLTTDDDRFSITFACNKFILYFNDSFKHKMFKSYREAIKYLKEIYDKENLEREKHEYYI